MKWNEVRNLYPNQFVKFEVLKSHIEENREFVDEVAVIGPVLDEEATKKLLQAKDNVLVYHTSKDSVVIKHLRLLLAQEGQLYCTRRMMR